MNRRFRIEGIYDSKSMLLFKASGIRHFGFDFRPRSFNFIQTYRLLELIGEHFETSHSYDLHFCGEKDFVIEKITADLDEKLSRQTGRNIWDHARLEFSDTQPVSFYDQFNAPFILHYHEELIWRELALAQNIKGLVMPYSYLLDLHERNEFTQFMARFNHEKQACLPHADLYLSLDWGANIFPSLFEFLDVNIFNMPVNRKLESSYRNIDPAKVDNELKICKGLLMEESPLQRIPNI